MTPELRRVLTYKSVWAMCIIGKDGRLRKTHYGSCVVSGRSPLWILFTIHGNPVRFYGSKQTMMDDHPTHVWRRQMVQWNMADDTDTDAQRRRMMLAEQLKMKLPDDDEVVTASPRAAAHAVQT
jgi:hypothetical protein